MTDSEAMRELDAKIAEVRRMCTQNEAGAPDDYRAMWKNHLNGMVEAAEIMRRALPAPEGDMREAAAAVRAAIERQPASVRANLAGRFKVGDSARDALADAAFDRWVEAESDESDHNWMRNIGEYALRSFFRVGFAAGYTERKDRRETR